MAVQVLPSLTRLTGALDDYPFIVLKPDGTKRDITNDFIEIRIGQSDGAVFFSGDSSDPTKVEKDDPLNGGWTLHIAPNNSDPENADMRYAIRFTPDATAPGVTSVVFEGTITFKQALYPLLDFIINPTSLSVSIVAGGTDNQNVDVVSVNGFAGAVTLSTVVAPVVVDGPIASIGTPAVVPSGGLDTEILSISTVLATPPGSYTVTITGLIGSLTHVVTVDVTVT